MKMIILVIVMLSLGGCVLPEYATANNRWGISRPVPNINSYDTCWVHYVLSYDDILDPSTYTTKRIIIEGCEEIIE